MRAETQKLRNGMVFNEPLERRQFLRASALAVFPLLAGCATRAIVQSPKSKVQSQDEELARIMPPPLPEARGDSRPALRLATVVPPFEPEMLLLDDDRFLATSGEVGWRNSIQWRMITPSACEVSEGCNQSTNPTPIITYDITLVRIKPTTWTGPTRTEHPDWFEWDDCHGHWHLKFATEIGLFNAFTGEQVGIGHKEGFCWRNLRRYTGNNPPLVSQCDAPVIASGWGDNYGPTTPCNGIDVTGVPEGYYYLRLTIDPHQLYGLHQSVSQLVYLTATSVTKVVPPSLTITNVAEGVKVTWSGDSSWHLQSSADGTNWNTHYEAVSGFTEPADAPQKFFRLTLTQ